MFGEVESEPLSGHLLPAGTGQGGLQPWKTHLLSLTQAPPLSPPSPLSLSRALGREGAAPSTLFLSLLHTRSPPFAYSKFSTLGSGPFLYTQDRCGEGIRWCEPQPYRGYPYPLDAEYHHLSEPQFPQLVSDGLCPPQNV